MTIAKKDSRQDILVAMVPFTFADFTANDGTLEDAIELPQNAVVVGGGIVIDTAFNGTTSDTLTVGDSDVDDRYKAGIDAQATGYTALVPTAFKMLAQGNVGIGNTNVGGVATAGAGRLILEYVVDGRAHHTQG